MQQRYKKFPQRMILAIPEEEKGILTKSDEMVFHILIIYLLIGLSLWIFLYMYSPGLLKFVVNANHIEKFHNYKVELIPFDTENILENTDNELSDLKDKIKLASKSQK